MKAIIFDMDGVLVDAMPFHYEAMKTAIKELANIDLDKRTFYLLEGMPVAEMALEIFKIRGYLVADSKKNNASKEEYIQKSEEVAKRKKEIFREMNIIPKPYDGIRELIINDLTDCMKAVVSGVALQRLNADYGTSNNAAIVVENAPLGIKAANDADILSIVTMNTSPLAITDFKEWISEDMIFKDTMSGGRFLKKWCISGGES